MDKDIEDAKNAASIRDIAHAVELDEQDKRTKNVLVAALREVLHSDTDEASVLVKRIPFICNDIRTMKDDISKINANISKGVWIVLGAVILALLKLILIP